VERSIRSDSTRICWWSQLAYIRYHFDNKLVPPSWFKSQMIRSNVDTVYFGLGNHDIQSTDHPNVSWPDFNVKFEGPTRTISGIKRRISYVRCTPD